MSSDNENQAKVGEEAQPEQQSTPVVEDKGVQDNSTQSTTEETAPAPEEAKQPEVQVPPVVQEASKKTNEVVTDIQVLLDKIKAEGTPTEQALLKGLDAYVNVMAPGKAVDSKTGALQQHTLWQNLRFVVQSSPDGEFSRLWNLVLAFAHLHKDGAFHERYIMRFSEDWHYDLDDLTAFQRLINLIKLTADSAKREQTLKQVDINRTLDKGFNDRGRTRLISFYS